MGQGRLCEEGAPEKQVSGAKQISPKHPNHNHTHTTGGHTKHQEKRDYVGPNVLENTFQASKGSGGKYLWSSQTRIGLGGE